MRVANVQNYPTVDLPDIVTGSARSVAGLTRIDDWFTSIRGQRLQVVRDFAQREGINPISLDEPGLSVIASFYLAALPRRRRSQVEIEAIRAELSPAIRNTHRIPHHELVEPAFSMLFDLGIFWGEVFIAIDPSLKWSIEGEEGLPSTGQPIISGPNSKSRFCPNQVLLTCAKQSIEDRLPAEGVLKYHRNWLKLL